MTWDDWLFESAIIFGIYSIMFSSTPWLGAVLNFGAAAMIWFGSGYTYHPIFPRKK